MNLNMDMNMMNMNKCQLVRDTCRWVCQNSSRSSSSVRFMPEKINQLLDKFAFTPFNEFEHHNVSEEEDTTLLYLFVLDSLNFCFWPLEGFEYEDLANSVKQFIQRFQTQKMCLENMVTMTEDMLNEAIFNNVQVPLASERARIIREISGVILTSFNGSAREVVQKANKSAVRLLNILTSFFPNWQDHSIYEGHQIHFYKRAQILIGDIYAKFNGKGLGQFTDIEELTMFPDYRVPQILNEYGILYYPPALQQKIDNHVQIQSGSAEQIQIRAHSVYIVEKIKQHLRSKGKPVKSIEVDWFLWEEGEKNLKKICPHHRTLTIYY